MAHDRTLFCPPYAQLNKKKCNNFLNVLISRTKVYYKYFVRAPILPSALPIELIPRSPQLTDLNISKGKDNSVTPTIGGLPDRASLTTMLCCKAHADLIMIEYLKYIKRTYRAFTCSEINSNAHLSSFRRILNFHPDEFCVSLLVLMPRPNSSRTFFTYNK